MAYLAAGHEKVRIPFDFILALAVFETIGVTLPPTKSPA